MPTDSIPALWKRLCELRPEVNNFGHASGVHFCLSLVHHIDGWDFGDSYGMERRWEPEAHALIRDACMSLLPGHCWYQTHNERTPPVRFVVKDHLDVTIATGESLTTALLLAAISKLEGER